MAKSDLIVAVDIGSGKMTAVVAAQNVETNMLEVLAGKSIPCSGIRGGIVCDITETAAAIEALVLSLARDCDEKSFDQLFIGLRGSHLESFASHGTYNISRPDKEISENDMELAKENAKAVAIKNNYEIVNIIEQEYTINKQRGIRNPEGMEASLLEVDVQIVTGATAHLRNLTKAIQRKFHIEGSVYGLIALGDAVLSSDEKENGAVLIDFGGETISVGIYIGGLLRFSRDIPYGCDLITNDLSRVLRTQRKSAKKIKEHYGVAHPSLLKKEDVSVPLMDGYNTRQVSTMDILDCVQPCVEEILEHVEQTISLGGYDLKNLPLVGVITGGGSMMPGMDLQCMNILGLKEVRRGRIPRDLVEAKEEFFDPQYSTAMALAIYVAKTTGYERYNAKAEGLGFFNKIGQGIKNILGF